MARKHFQNKLWHMYDAREPVTRWGMTHARRHDRRQLKRELAVELGESTTEMPSSPGVTPEDPRLSTKEGER